MTSSSVEPTPLACESMLPASLDQLLSDLSTAGPRHMLYVPGPGDVAGTYRHWCAGRDDPSIPSVAYSAQVFELAEWISAHLTVLTEEKSAIGDGPHKTSVAFEQISAPEGRGVRYHLSEIAYALRIVCRAVFARADMIVMQRTLVHVWPVALARLFGIRYVICLHNTLWPVGAERRLRERLLHAFNGWAFRRSEGVLGVSRAISAQVCKVAGPRFRKAVVHVPQYNEAWLRIAPAHRSDRPLKRVLYLGRVEENKGVFDLLDAFAHVGQQHPELCLRVIGDGSARTELMRRTAGLAPDIAARIEIPGPAHGEGVFAELATADLLVCPTTGRFAEGLAKTPIEAALVGVPSLITSSVPAAEVLGEAIQTVQTDDVKALAAALERLSRDPVRLAAMSSAAIRARQQFFDRKKSLGAQLVQVLARSLPAVTRRPIPTESTAVSMSPSSRTV
ncbi:MAG: glycosyltransferase family 4 protein [Pseudomonadota bacterium]